MASSMTYFRCRKSDTNSIQLKTACYEHGATAATAAPHETEVCIREVDAPVTEVGLLVYRSRGARRPEGASRARGSMETVCPIPGLGVVVGCAYRTWCTRRKRHFHEPHRPREASHHGSARSDEAPATPRQQRLTSLALLHDYPCQLRARRDFLRARTGVNQALAAIGGDVPRVTGIRA
jgi:hypothetical protein